MPNFLLFMTPGIGLSEWQKIGSLKRELKPYVEYVKRGWKVKILTFDKGKVPKLPDGLEAVVFKDHRLLWFLPWTHRELGKWADVIKTNQANYAYLYTRAAKKWKKPILLRCGYLLSEYLENTEGLIPKVRFYQWIEAKAFRQATHCQVPTKELSEWVQRKYKIPDKKISVVPNFVDTDLFKPMPEVRKMEKSIISVGRLAPVKQFNLLIRACAEIPGCTLTIVGEGPERKNLENLAEELKVNLRLPGNIPNEELPKMLNQHQIFAITSVREGHPKALIEAMSCGIACLGTNTTGIINVIDHDHNGVLVTTEIGDIANGISNLLEDEELRKKLGKASKEFVMQHYSVSTCFSKELNDITKLAMAQQ